MSDGMERTSDELERRSRYLSGLIATQHQKNKKQQPHRQVESDRNDHQHQDHRHIPRAALDDEDRDGNSSGGKNVITVRASDMPPELQKRAFRCAREALAAMPKLHSKHLALSLKKEFDSTYGPAWHCIVGTSFGSYVTHSLGGFLYFSIDKVYILLFRTAVEPLDQ